MSLFSLCAVANALDAAPQPFPSKIIRIVVPPGSSPPPDIISRVIAAELSESEGWRVVVENRPGAIQSIGVADILKQNADGYSLLVTGVPMMAAPALLPNVSFHPEKDLAPGLKTSVSYNRLGG